jgi:hypothetical protein
MHAAWTHILHVGGERETEAYLKMGATFSKKFKIVKVEKEWDISEFIQIRDLSQKT